jgi:hypothetical protein
MVTSFLKQNREYHAADEIGQLASSDWTIGSSEMPPLFAAAGAVSSVGAGGSMKQNAKKSTENGISSLMLSSIPPTNAREGDFEVFMKFDRWVNVSPLYYLFRNLKLSLRPATGNQEE